MNEKILRNTNKDHSIMYRENESRKNVVTYLVNLGRVKRGCRQRNVFVNETKPSWNSGSWINMACRAPYDFSDVNSMEGKVQGEHVWIFSTRKELFSLSNIPFASYSLLNNLMCRLPFTFTLVVQFL